MLSKNEIPVNAFNYKPKDWVAVRIILRNFHIRTCNNYRKLHKLPMRRWVQLRKVKEE